MRSIRMYSLVTASLLALGAAGCGDFEKDAPETAVRDFLSHAVSTGNGQRACDHLTAAGQQQVAGAAAKDEQDAAVGCRIGMERSVLVVDGEFVDDLNEVKDLDYEAETEGHDATVTVSGEGLKPITFRLKHDDALGNLYEPSTPWRIESGAEALVRTGS
ncbi:MAG: hypothetical protein M0P31_16190 [Solirubrobacteraceae bacterium]|nr:hypothetical protein [Solirubrobacteraceae bacterium]